MQGDTLRGMYARILAASSILASLFAFEATGRATGSSGWDPAPPLACCSNGCVGINGTCGHGPNCTITCNTGYTDCDGNLATGCECGGSNGCGVQACDNTTVPAQCKRAPANEGGSCSSECIMNATCRAGECIGDKA